MTHSQKDVFDERIFVGDELVGGRDDKRGGGVDVLDAVGGPCHDGGGVATNTLAEKTLGRKVRQLLHNHGRILGEGGNEDMVLGQDVAETLVGLLKQRLARAEEIDELFRLRAAADGPQAPPLASRKDEAIEMVGIICLVFHDGNCLWWAFIEPTLFLVSNAKLPKICIINEKLRCFYVFLANGGQVFTTTKTT